MITRILDLKLALQKKSHFLLGPRQTGKSSLIREQLKGIKLYDLLLKETFRALSHDPSRIRQELMAKDRIIIIDEVQKLPELLDEVQWMIENKGIHFLLTGSSARKLKKYGTNLLGGRARLLRMHPFIKAELKSQFDLQRALQYGLIPSVYCSDEPEEDLDAYIGMYMQQEVANEALTRNLSAFSRVLEIAALGQAQLTNFSAVSNDAQVPRTTVHEYYQILEDTLMIHRLEPWGELKKRKPIATPKIYFFDWGLARKLQGHDKVPPKTPLYGVAFESYIFQELKAYCDYSRHGKLHFWRTQEGHEVDFILNEEIAIEVKARADYNAKDLSSMQMLLSGKKVRKGYLVYLGSHRTPSSTPGIEVLPYTEFLERLWSGDL